MVEPNLAVGTDPVSPVENRFALVCLALVVATVVAYSPSLVGEFEFVNVDDNHYVTANPHVQRGLTLDGARWALTAFDCFSWHPLTWLSLQLDSEFGTSADGYRRTNVLIHALNAILLFWLLRRLTGAFWPSAAVAALFALHPTQVESVAWVSERKGVLCMLFSLLTLATYAWYAERPSLGRYLLILAPFILGLMSKAMLVTLPPALLLLDYWPLQRWRPGQTVEPLPSGRTYAPASLRWLVLEKLPLLALVVVVSLLTLRAGSPIVGTLEQYPLAVRLPNALVNYVVYIGMLLWPVDLAIYYPHPRDTLPWWQPVCAGLVLAAFTGVIFWAGRRRRYLAVGWLWYLGTMVPMIGLVQVATHVRTDHYLYLPSIGLFVMAAWGLADLCPRRTPRATIAAVLMGAVLVGCFLLTWRQVGFWRNSETLWRHAVEVSGSSYVAHERLGMALADKGQFEEARAQLEHALTINPHSAPAQGNLAILLDGLGLLGEAETRYRKTLELDPGLALAHSGLGNLLEGQGRLEEAYKHHQAALRLHPDSPAFHTNLGRVLRRRGQPSTALEHYDQAISLDPSFAQAHNNKGLVLESLGDLPKAITCYDQAVTLQPDNLAYRCNLAYALHQNGEIRDQEYQLREAFRIQPDWPLRAAQEAWGRATHPDPGLRDGAQALRTARLVCLVTGYRQPECLDILAAAHAELGQFDDAVAWAKKALELAPAQQRPELNKEIQNRIDIYLKKQPFRETPAKQP